MNLKKLWQMLTPPEIREYWSAWLIGILTGAQIGIIVTVLFLATRHFLVWGGFIVR